MTWRRTLWISALLLCMNACHRRPVPPPPSSVVSVEGDAYQERSSGGKVLEMLTSYRVHFRIKNGGQDVVSFDGIEAAFHPNPGSRLRVKITTLPKPGKDGVEPLPTSSKTIALASGESHECKVTTKTYTDRLLADAGGQPLKFSVTLLKGGLPVARAFIAELPPLVDLPLYDDYWDPGKEKPKGTPLSFSR